MKAREKFCQQYQREATIEEISEITKITREEIVTSLEASNEVESIHQSAYQKDGSEISLLDKLIKRRNESEKCRSCSVKGSHETFGTERTANDLLPIF